MAVLLILSALAGSGTDALAGGIAGTITDAATGLPLTGIDLDIFDANWTAVAGVNAVTAADGTYLLTPLPAGDYYLRADPSAAQGYVDQYHPGFFLKGQATPITVPEFGSVIVNFALVTGKDITGTMYDAGTGLPVAGIDLDVFATDRSFIGSVNARTAADGTYTLGAFPPGSYFVEADPETTMYVAAFYSGRADLASANSVQVTSSVGTTGIDFQLVTGGKISGTITDQATGLPLSGIDLDLYDEQGNFLSRLNTATLADGTYLLGAMPAGTYFLRADPTPLQGYQAVFFGGGRDILTATPITVSAGVVSSLVDFALVPGGTISGTVISAATGLPVAGARVSVFDSLGSILPRVGANTAADGSFIVGALPAGNYFLRCGGDVAQALAYQFYPGVNMASLAQPLAATVGADMPGVNFALQKGGWITGTVRDQATLQPVPLVDMDVYSPNFEFIGALDATTTAAGGYLLGPVPDGRFVVRAHPAAATGYAVQYYYHSPDTTAVLPVDVVAPSAVTGIDFDLALRVLSVDGRDIVPAGVRLQEAVPNPFNPRTTVSFDLPRDADVDLSIYTVRGTKVATLVHGARAAGHHEMVWNGLDGHGSPVASGVYLARLEDGRTRDMTKLVLVR